MTEEDLLSKESVLELINIPKRYFQRKSPKDILYHDIKARLEIKQNNSRYESTKISVIDDKKREFLIIIQNLKDDDISSYTANFFLLKEKKQIFLCRLDYNKPHLRKCRRDSFKNKRAGVFHFHIHCKECYSQYGIDGVDNIAFSLDDKKRKIEGLDDFCLLFLNKINVKTARNFSMIKDGNLFVDEDK